MEVVCIEFNNKRTCARFLDYIGNNSEFDKYHLNLTLPFYKVVTYSIYSDTKKVEWNFYDNYYCSYLNNTEEYI